MSYLRHDVSVLVADGHGGVRKFVTTLLQDKGLRVVGEAADGHEAVGLCEQLRPDVLALDTCMPLLNGFDAAREIAKLSPATKIIFLALDTMKIYADEALRVGGMGLVFKERLVLDLLAAIDAAMRGEKYFTGLN